ncbi:hypothetical protein BGW36DRAFT_457422 [Talaromyces proteolyticus]|uniref:Rhodopsin domain-containing protein n=1 Tax=Talaromyces proteolyticus TaxID=1131652 RepID=A0AAD4Q4J1_9EURO|nr:uncharacterized protein BGW36DRAFT_457422 [Talaromyces proteolyticus]KAH8703070.1 hypothetical protein BGW36DRAFT_457422 [Talaromyces proteolyticus]
MNQVLNNGVNIGISDSERYKLTFMPEEYARFVYGAKCYYAAWFVYMSLIWALKACTLVLFNRITLGLWQQKVVKWNAIFVGLSYIAIILAFCLECRPIQGNWQIYPNPGRQCTNDLLNYYLIGPINILTDAILLVVPFPIVNRTNISFSKKIGLSLLLSSGVFIIIASSLRWAISVNDIANVSTGAAWAIREGFIATIVVNLPPIYTLFARLSKRDSELLIFEPPVNNGRSVTTCIGMQRVESSQNNHEDSKNFIFGLGRRRSDSSDSGSLDARRASEGIKITTTYEVA